MGPHPARAELAGARIAIAGRTATTTTAAAAAAATTRSTACFQRTAVLPISHVRRPTATSPTTAAAAAATAKLGPPCTGTNAAEWLRESGAREFSLAFERQWEWRCRSGRRRRRKQQDQHQGYNVKW
jgi:hypothetical protein